MPKAGKIIIYTSGCPKNQNRCRNRMGSPPPSGIKKVVPKFLSVSNMVIAPASTGTASNSKKAVINIAHANSGILCKVIPGVRILKIVVIKFAAPRIDETPAR